MQLDLKYQKIKHFDFMINNATVCQAESRQLSYLIYVHSSPEHFKQRQMVGKYRFALNYTSDLILSFRNIMSYRIETIPKLGI